MDNAEPKLVECINCGFAAKRTVSCTPDFPSLTYFEIGRDERDSNVQFEITPSLITIAACYTRSYDLDALAKALVRERKEAYPVCVYEVLERPRKCDQWCLHVPGRTPQQHVDMIETQRLFAIAEKNLMAAQKTLTATWIIGVIVIGLMLLQLFGVWPFSQRPSPPVIIQIPERTTDAPIQR